jgi:ribonuclease VapC
MGGRIAVTLVIDASALLAIQFGERGADVAIAHCRGASLSAVNLDEVLHKGVLRGIPADVIEDQIRRLQIAIVPFTVDHARVAAGLHPRLHRTNTSFADRACMALALVERCPVLTADRKWADLDMGVELILIR